MGELVPLPLPFMWGPFTHRQLDEMDEATFQSVKPQHPPRPSGQGREDDWWEQQYRPYRAASEKWHTAQRRRLAASGPHPNWENRKKRCAVRVEVEFGSKGAASWGYKLPHRARWERVHQACGKAPVAWDGTDRRRVGYMYGACAEHIAEAMAADPARVWFWANGTRIDETFDFEGELTMLVLGGLRAGA